MPLAIRAADVTRTLGVHGDVSQGNWSSIPNLIAQAQYAGIATVRCGVPIQSDWTRELQNDIANSGLKMEMTANTGGTPQANADAIAAFATAHPGTIVFTEGPNEPDHWPVDWAGQTGSAGAQAWQADFYSAMKANPVTAGILVSGMSNWPKIAAASDLNNLHIYPNNGDQPADYIAGEVADQLAVDPGKNFVITEMGYYVGPGLTQPGTFWAGVNEATQAKLLLNAYLDTVRLGGLNFGIYSLRDWPDNDAGSRFGIFHNDDTPKPAATALRNLQAVLADASGTARTFTPGSLAYTTTAPAGTYSLLAQKASGEYVLALWREPDIWDQAAQGPITATGATFSVNLTAPANAAVYDPMVGSTATQTASAATALTVTVTDHPILVSLAPVVAATSSTVSMSAGAWTSGFGATDLNALANGAQRTSALTAPQVDNTAGALYVQFEVALAALTPAAGGHVIVALIPETRTTGTYVTGADGTVVGDQVRWQNYPHAMITLRGTAASAQTLLSGLIPIQKRRYKVALINRAGVALPASGNQVFWRTLTDVVA